MAGIRLLPFGLLALVSCAGEKPGGPATGDSGVEDSGPTETGEPDNPSADLCDRLVAGPADDRETVIALSEAHAAVRLFGTHDDFLTPDAALVASISAGPDSPDLATYASMLDLCLLDAAAPLGAASVSTVGSLAWIVPGTGDVTLPDGALGVVIDLRGLPEDPALGDALRAAVAPALATSVAGVDLKVRRWYGFVDQWYSSSNAYKTSVTTLGLGDLEASGETDLPLVLVTDARLAPEAARFAVALAMAGRAWIVGEDIPTRVAEQSWAALGEQGLLYTAALAEWDGEDVPDTIAASARTADPEAMLAAADLATWGTPPVPAGELTREAPPRRRPYDETFPEEESGDAVFQADLVVAHGVLRAFYPYFSVVGDDLDLRLAEVLASTAADREAQLVKLGRLGEALSDGHCFFGDYYREGAAGWLPVSFDHLDGRPVVVHSLIDQLVPGDTIMAVDGEPVEDIYAELLSWHGAASEGYAYNLTSRVLNRMDGTTTYTVEAADGGTREEVIEPQSSELYAEVPWAFHVRDNGTLDDLGAPDISYLNMGYEVTTDIDQVSAAIEAAATGAGLIVDMRGYPGINHYTVVGMLWEDEYSTPWFNVTSLYGPFAEELQTALNTYSADGDYTGPLVVLTSPITVSAAENFLMMLVDRPDTTFVGRGTAATNGNITGMRLPGGFYLSFTGMEVLFPDGSTFHGVGIVPDLEVVPTAQDYADGVDPELLAAIEVLTGG